MMLLFQIFLSVDILLLLSSLANETETENANKFSKPKGGSKSENFQVTKK